MLGRGVYDLGVYGFFMDEQRGSDDRWLIDKYRDVLGMKRECNICTK